MENNSQQVKTLGSVGGMAATATPGGYNQGNMIAGKAGQRGDSSPQMAGNPKNGGNALVAGHFGPSTGPAPAGQFGQGDMFAAGMGEGSAVGMGGVKKGGNVLNGAFPGGPDQAPGGSGYAQGDEYAATTK